MAETGTEYQIEVTRATHINRRVDIDVTCFNIDLSGRQARRKRSGSQWREVACGIDWLIRQDIGKISQTGWIARRIAKLVSAAGIVRQNAATGGVGKRIDVSALIVPSLRIAVGHVVVGD